MNERPFISLITVCYNSERYIGKMIESVLDQDFADYEYIIVDGKSKDATTDVIRSYETEFKGRLRWISEPDSGIYDAMNKGIHMAKGMLVWILGSDDFMEKGAMRSVYNTFMKFDKDKWPIVSFSYNRVDREGNFICKIFFDAKKCEWCAKRDYMGLIFPAMLVPIEVYKRHELFDTWYRVISDLDWFRRVYNAGEKMAFIDIPIASMRDGGASGTHYYKDRIKEYRYYCYKNYSWLEATIRFLRLWLQQNYGHIISKYHIR